MSHDVFTKWYGNYGNGWLAANRAGDVCTALCEQLHDSVAFLFTHLSVHHMTGMSFFLSCCIDGDVK